MKKKKKEKKQIVINVNIEFIRFDARVYRSVADHFLIQSIEIHGTTR